jgi:hypothetical protein
VRRGADVLHEQLQAGHRARHQLPGSPHVDAARVRHGGGQAGAGVLRYLRGTLRLGLLFRFTSDAEHPGLAAYADASWADDELERRSTSGYVVLYNGTPVSWHSGLQNVIALSTCESEYVALSDCCRELAYLRELLGFLRSPESTPTPIYEDNQGAIDVASDAKFHKRTKHIAARYHYVRLAQSEGKVAVTKIHTDLNRADIFTKATAAVTFHRHVDAIMHTAGESRA